MSDLEHYDNVSSALLSTSTAMIAILISFLPIILAIDPGQEALIAVDAVIVCIFILAFSTIFSLLGLTTKHNIERKRKLCIIAGLLILLTCIFLLAYTVYIRLMLLRNDN